MDGAERGEHREADATEDTASACCGAQLLASMRSSPGAPDDQTAAGRMGGEAHRISGGVTPRATAGGKAKLTAHKERLAIDTPKYEHMMTANLTRRRSADETLWRTYTEPVQLPSYVDSRQSAKTAPYQEEVVCRNEGSRCRSIFGLPMVRPESKTATVWHLIMKICDVTYTAFLVPLSFAFFHDVRVFNWMSVFDIVGGVLYVMDVVCAFHIGVVMTKSMHARLVLDGRLVAQFYMRHSTFCLDLLAASPLVPEIALLCVSTQGDRLKTFSDVIAWLRLARLLRLMPLLRSLAVLSLTGHYNRKMLAIMPSSMLLLLHIVYMYLFLANLLANVWYYTAEAQGLQNSWLTSVGSNSADLTGASGPSKYVASFYYCTTFLSTVGFGDVTATTDAERVVASVMMVIGIAFFGFLLGVLQSVIQRGSVAGRRADMYRERIADVEAYMHYAELPGPLRRKIRAYYAEVWVRHDEVDEEGIVAQLPVTLRGEVATYLMDETLRKSSAFGNLDASARELVAAMLEPVPLAPGHLLFKQGDPADSIYILQDGECATYRNTMEIERIFAPYLIGELAILNAEDREHLDELPHHQHFSLRALTLSMFWRLRLRDLVPLLSVQPGLQRDLVEDLCFVLRRLQGQQPDEAVWGDALKAAEKRLTEVNQEVAQKGGQPSQQLGKEGTV